jgi:kynureninase
MIWRSLAPRYSRFRVAERLLLTGHSHQAWPDVAFEAQQRAWLDAAERVDDKWERAAEIADVVRGGWRRLLNDPGGDIALGQNTHELVVRLLSAVLEGGVLAPPYGATKIAPSSSSSVSSRSKLITSDGEFHTIRRQLARLAETGIEVLKVPTSPVDTLAERMASSVDDHTACVLVSSVLFETAEIVPNLAHLAHVCALRGAQLLVDAYHHLNVVPFDISAMGLETAFVVGGGYKYCQLGEGNCFLRVPPGCELRPVLTGWFSEFARLAHPPHRGAVPYGEGAARFAGATYDPTSHYRAAAVFAFHEEMGLTPDRLRAISRHQIGLLAATFQALDTDPAAASLIDLPPERRAGFLAIRAPRAGDIVHALRSRGMLTDARGKVLRLGPAPYLSDAQLHAAISELAEVVS